MKPQNQPELQLKPQSTPEANQMQNTVVSNIVNDSSTANGMLID